MMHCAMIYNPAAGRNRDKKPALLHSIQERLIGLGHSVELIQTTAPGSGGAQARNAIADGAQIVFACGGDGTVHEVLQGCVALEKKPPVSMGILPMGSANALARHLGLSLDPLKAALQQIDGEPVAIPVGKLTSLDCSRYFTVMAGMGPDGLLAYEVLTTHKSKLGRFAYYLHAARLFVSRPFTPFAVEYREPESSAVRMRRAASIMVIRIHDLGGLFRSLIPHKENLLVEHLRLIVLSPPGFLSLPLWFALGWLGIHRWNPFLHSMAVSHVACRPLSIAQHFQADGEWLGRGQIELCLLPRALQLRLPANLLAKIR